MILKLVKIENYKCIEDSGDFSIEPVTCLVGKNESGKTAILQSIYTLNPDLKEKAKFNPLLDYPRRKYSAYKERHKNNPDPILTTEWELEEKDIEAIEKRLSGKVFKKTKVILNKGYDNKTYCKVETDEKRVVRNFLNSSNLPRVKKQKLRELETINELIAKLEKISNPSEPETELLGTLKEIFPNRNLQQTVANIIKEKLPIFLYFANYYQLPGQVSIQDLQNKKSENELDFSDEVFLALLELAGTNCEDIDSMGRFEELIAELEAVSNRLSQEIFEYWSQNKHLEVKFLFDHARPEDKPPFNEGYVFRTRIYNKRHGVTVSFDERSAGFVWFFSFLIWFSQVKRNYGENLIILLDDPALNLHARAQGDLLRYINEKLKPHHQVIYTTHSPFMIDPENMLSVRTVEDVIVDEDIQGTKVGDKVFSTDRDTVFPLQAALGYDITQTLFVGKHTLLVEGPSDLIYIKWFSRELQKKRRIYLDHRWTIAPCGGIDKIGSFIALFRGSELNVAVFTDFHTGQKKKIRHLKESALLKASHILSAERYIDQDEADIEDLLGRLLYVSLVNKCYSLPKRKMLPQEKPPSAPMRVLKEVEQYFATLPPSFEEFDHYAPASFLMENASELKNNLPDMDRALDRFEELFKDINKLLPQ